MAWINIALLLLNDIVNSPLIFINLFVSANTTPHSSKKDARNMSNWLQVIKSLPKANEKAGRRPPSCPMRHRRPRPPEEPAALEKPFINMANGCWMPPMRP